MNRLPTLRANHRQRGLSLIELMVAMTISLIVVAAALYLYLGTRESQRAVDEASIVSEGGSYALQVIGRELMNAGFYPTVRPHSADTANVVPAYLNPTAQSAYDFGIFGCEGGRFNPADGTCPTPADGAPDSIVVAYFTNDNFGTSVGQRTDCTGAYVDSHSANTARVPPGGATSALPAAPLFVSNRFGLSDTTQSVDGQETTTQSLACSGSGSTDQAYQPLMAGIEDLQITYGVMAENSTTLAPEEYLPTDEISGAVWGRVVTVRVCVVSRSTLGNAALAGDSSGQRSFTDCDGNVQEQAAGDSTIRKSFVQTFGIRNRQTQTY